MLINGRHPILRAISPKYNGHVTEYGTIRIDDSANPDFWLEVKLSDDEIVALNKGHCSVQEEEEELIDLSKEIE